MNATIVLLLLTGCDDLLGLRVPEGFEVTEFADGQLANDIYSMTIDSRGRVFVAGRGYMRTLVDDDRDGRADRAITFADLPADGAMGLYWESTTLFFVGNGGLWRLRDDNGDDRADGPPELIRKMKTGGEHDAHDIKRGPDGWLYVLCGNMTGVDSRFAETPHSPIKQPVAGCIVRFSPDLQTSEIVADGFRNAYRMDFNLDGELFTYDSDNERCVSLPWYEPTRFYHVLPGGHYGWRSPQGGQFWRLPPYAVDVVAPAATLGRGSPTGTVCYRHTQFPERYRGGFFLADWTFGRIYHVSLEPSGSSYTTRVETFIEAVGENGFAPTDLAVDASTGDLFTAIGGRGTRGAVYRVRNKSANLDAARALDMAQKSLGWNDGDVERLLRAATAGDDATRRQAIHLMERHRERFTAEQLATSVRANAGHRDRYIRLATANLIAAVDDADRTRFAARPLEPRELVTHALGATRNLAPDTAHRVATLLATARDRDVRLNAIRLFQLVCGGMPEPKTEGTIWEGYTLSNLKAVPPDAFRRAVLSLRTIFPSGDHELDRELTRTLAALQDDDGPTLEEVAAQLTERSDPVDDIHYLAVLARLTAARKPEHTEHIARSLLAIDRKMVMRELNRDRNWPLRVAEIHRALAERDRALNERIVSHANFGRPDHVLFTDCPGFDRERAARVFFERARTESDFVWNAALVKLVATLPDESVRRELDRLWDRADLRDVIVGELAHRPRDTDRRKFVEGLSSPQLATVRASLDALGELAPAVDAAEFLAFIRLMRRLRGGNEDEKLRERVGKLLQRATQEALPETDERAWADWFTNRFPDLAARLTTSDGVDAAAWQSRLEGIDWSSGDAERGRAVYTQASCVACHSGARAVGPDLRGVANRFARDDLFTAIVQPSRDVSPRYQTTLVATENGKVFQGTVIYEAVDSLILQTGSDSTVRITNAHITDRRVTADSLMPAGLLDKASDQDIADLYAYLRGLR